MLSGVARGQPDQTQVLVVEDEMQGRRLEAPVEVGVLEVGIASHDLAHLASDLAEDGQLGACDAEQHRVAHRRPEKEAGDADARLREVARRDDLGNARLQRIALGRRLGLDDDLRVSRIEHDGSMLKRKRGVPWPT